MATQVPSAVCTAGTELLVGHKDTEKGVRQQVQRCAGCSRAGGNWKTCPRNPARTANAHVDGGGEAGTPNGRRVATALPKGHPGQYHAPYLATGP